MKIRLAKPADVDQLIKMRWDFTLKDDESGNIKDEEFAGRPGARQFKERAV